MDGQRQEYMNDCEKLFPASNSNRESNIEKSKISIFENGFSISPNPASSSITITYKKIFNFMCIEELNGKLVTSYPINNETKSEVFDISDLANGLYILKLSNQENVTRVKLIISQ